MESGAPALLLPCIVGIGDPNSAKLILIKGACLYAVDLLHIDRNGVNDKIQTDRQVDI